MPCCKVNGCNVGSRCYKGPKYQLFAFPKDEENQQVWLDRIQRPDLISNVTRDTRICERHFMEEAFVPEEENVDSFNRKRVFKRLKPKAFPTLHLGLEKVRKIPLNSGYQHRLFW